MRSSPGGPGFVEAVRRNIALAEGLSAAGDGPEVVGTVSGSAAARAFWQGELEQARAGLGARVARSFHEDLPTNQAFGVLLLWQRLRPELTQRGGALVAFVFGEGTRAAPFTETDGSQKSAIQSFRAVRGPQGPRYLSMVELALVHFIPVERFLHRSGFRGLVVKWGDEVQIPSRDLSGTSPLFAGADVVRFVSLRVMDADQAANKDWVGVDPEGNLTAFLPRRPLALMEGLADRGVLRRHQGRIHGGVNLGSIALSDRLLDALLEEFGGEVNDPGADRSRRPDLDPQFFSALTVAALAGSRDREQAWDRERAGSEALRRLDGHMPELFGRLCRLVDRFEGRHGRRPRLVAMDFGEPYWGDIGQHAAIHDFYMALNRDSDAGRIARAIAGLAEQRDGRGNRVGGATLVGRGVAVRDSVLLDAVLAGEGCVEGCVLIGTRARDIRARDAFDVGSTAPVLRLAPRAGTYKVVSEEPVEAGPGERLTTLFLPGGEEALFRVREDTDLRDREGCYDVPIHGNPMAFREAHERMGRMGPEELRARRAARRREVARACGWPEAGGSPEPGPPGA